MKPARIIIHHSLTKDSGTVSWSAIRRYHVVKKGWRDIGYHSGIELVGNDFECFYGRPTTQNGAHTKGANVDSLGFCFVGNFDDAPPSNELLYVAVRRVLMPWMVAYHIPLCNVQPHHAFVEGRSCPGKMFDMGKLAVVLLSELPETW